MAEESEQDILSGLLSVSDTLGESEADYNEDASFLSISQLHGHSSAMYDLEVDLPPVQDIPTLESILKESDEIGDVDLLRNLNLEDILNEEKSSDGKKNSQKKTGSNSRSSILRHIVLKKISAQVQSASNRNEAGLPTAMAVSSIIAVGTSHGIVLLFDREQVLQLVLGTIAQGADYGAVTALGINTNSTRLLCGHAKGQITMWDLATGKCVRTITDAHPPGSAVLHVLFTDDLTEAVCSDSGGSVFLLTFKKVIGMRTYESQVVFSGSRGEVCVLAPLHFQETKKDHPLYERSLLALATLTKVIVLALKPHFKVVFTFKLKGSADSLPLMAWYFAAFQVSDSTKAFDPILAFARESNIYIFRFHVPNVDEEDDISYSNLQQSKTTFKIISLHWLDTQVIALVDGLERIHVMDVKTGDILETLDLDCVQLVYSSSFFKSLSNGGNVSEALALASEHSCYQSVVSHNSQLLVLGRKSIHVFTIRTWDDRISFFVRQNDFVGGLEQALSFYNGSARGVLGLNGSKTERMQAVANVIESVVREFVDKILEKLNGREDEDEESLRQYFQETIPHCIDYCLAIDRLELLFNYIYEKFSAVDITREVFLESLQSYIQDDRLFSLTPIVLKDFVGHYQKKEKLKEVERCLIHLDLVNLDIDQTVKLCWKYELYDAVIYVYNRGMGDYGTPLEELLRILKEAWNSKMPLNDTTQELGYKLLVYISSCLAGRAYSVGDIPGELVKPVRAQVAETLLRREELKNPNDETYPNLRALLDFDTGEFLNVLSLAFEEAEFDEDCREGVSGRQRFINVLLEVMVQGTGFSPTQIGSFFTFMARQMAKHEGISLNKALFEQVLEYLSNPEDLIRHDEREQALLELLDSGALKQFDEERILVLAENGKFYQVCEILYIKRRQYGKVLSCYFRDLSRQHLVFEFVKIKMTDDSYTDLDQAELKQTVLKSLLDFVAVDTRRTAHMIIAHFPDSLKWAVQTLEEQQPILYNFLKSVFDISGSSLTKFEPPSDTDTNEKFIELMCKFEPAGVYRHLRSATSYRLQETLEIVKPFDIIDATAFLLEKAGDIKGAFSLLLQALEKCVKNVDQGFINRVNSKEMSKTLSACKATLLVIIQLCQRNSRRMDEYERENLWFPLLEVVMAPQRKLSDMTSYHFLAFKDLTRQVLNSMTGHISLPMILQKIMQDPTYNSGKFGEIRELIMGMLDTYSYEETLLTTTNHMLASDLHRSLNHMKGLLNRGIKPHQSICHLCQRPLIKSGMATKYGDLIIFRCQHSCHTECLNNELGNGVTWTCPLCSKKNSTRQKETKTEQPSVENTPGGNRVEKPGKSISLNVEQTEALTRLRKHFRGPSRLKMLNELSKDSDLSGLSYRSGRSRLSSKSLLQDDEFQLHLAPSSQFT